MMVAASGTLAAIAQAFGGTKSGAMAQFNKAIGGVGGAAGDGSQMAALRRRIHAMGDLDRGAA